MQVNRNVLFIFFMAETQWRTLGRLLRGFKKNFLELHYSKSKDFICNSTKAFAAAATNSLQVQKCERISDLNLQHPSRCQ